MSVDLTSGLWRWEATFKTPLVVELVLWQLEVYLSTHSNNTESSLVMTVKCLNFFAQAAFVSDPARAIISTRRQLGHPDRPLQQSINALDKQSRGTHLAVYVGKPSFATWGMKTAYTFDSRHLDTDNSRRTRSRFEYETRRCSWDKDSTVVA